MTISDLYAVKNPKGIIKEVQETTADWGKITNQLGISQKVSSRIEIAFSPLL